MRTTLRLLAGAALIAPGALGSEPGAVAVRAVPVPLHAGDEAVERIGELRYRAGFHLTSESEGFGGFSGLVVDASGRLTAVSDQGYWWSAELLLADDGTLAGLGAGTLGELCDDDGELAAGKERRDAEELQELPGQGLLVSFEHHHRIFLYPFANGSLPLEGLPRPFPFPPAVAPTHRNRGMEAVALLADGRLLTFAEDLRTADDDIVGWIGHPQRGDWRDLALATHEDFLPTGAALLPSGDVLLLERSYREGAGNRVRLSVLEAAGLTPGSRLRPRELALLEPPLTVDNMEAVAVRPGPRGEVLIYLLSDDNFSDRQRTLLMQLEWVDPATAR